MKKKPKDKNPILLEKNAQSIPLLVQKYGGSSLESESKISEVAKKIVTKKREGFQLVVVVSAMGKTTQMLLNQAYQLTSTPSKREIDMLISAGERISMALLSIAIQDLGEEATSLTGSQSGIFTNDNHSQAKIIEVRPTRIQDELEKGKIVIVAGFQGMSYKREITTLGRGGSDTTAAALTVALSAEYCEIFSDVDGIYSADPHRIPNARHYESVESQWMSLYAKYGAKVLQQDALDFVNHHNIAIYAKSTFGSDASTLVRKNPPISLDFWGVTGIPQVVFVESKKSDASCLLFSQEFSPLFMTSNESKQRMCWKQEEWNFTSFQQLSCSSQMVLQKSALLVLVFSSLEWIAWKKICSDFFVPEWLFPNQAMWSCLCEQLEEKQLQLHACLKKKETT